jgi:16S rRNA processing protein RimM
VRGRVTARLHGIEPEALVSLSDLHLLRDDGAERQTRVLGAQPMKNGWVLELESLVDRNEAEAWRGALLITPRSSLPEPGRDEWYVADLVGLRVVTEGGRELGTLDDVLKLPANDVFVVRGEQGEILLPVTEEVVCAVDVAAGRVTVHLLPGLVDGGEDG